MNLQMADSGYNPSSNLTVEMDEAKLMQLFKTLDTVQRNMDALSQWLLIQITVESLIVYFDSIVVTIWIDLI